MKKRFQDQLDRVDRLLAIVNAPDPFPLIGQLEFTDVVYFTIQCMWHLKDWSLNDQYFMTPDKAELLRDIHAQRCLLICSDLANGTKHLELRRPKVGATLDENAGIHLDGSKGICQHFYDVVCKDETDPYHRKEIRDFLAECRRTWGEIIDRHMHLEFLRELNSQPGV